MKRDRKLTEKTKRYLAVGGGVLLCIGLIAAIGLRFGSGPVTEDVLPAETSALTEVMVNPAEVEKEESGELEMETSVPVPGPETESMAASEETDTTAPVSDDSPEETSQEEQSIQPDVQKPDAPEEEVLTDPVQKPDGTKVETPPAPVEHDAAATPEIQEPAQTPNEPQAGDTRNGQIYIPGFGWVEDHGGGSSGTVAEDMYENGNKIGIMD